jgi:hypothetical protein
LNVPMTPPHPRWRWRASPASPPANASQLDHAPSLRFVATSSYGRHEIAHPRCSSHELRASTARLRRRSIRTRPGRVGRGPARPPRFAQRSSGPATAATTAGVPPCERVLAAAAIFHCLGDSRCATMATVQQSSAKPVVTLDAFGVVATLGIIGARWPGDACTPRGRERSGGRHRRRLCLRSLHPPLRRQPAPGPGQSGPGPQQ